MIVDADQLNLFLEEQKKAAEDLAELIKLNHGDLSKKLQDTLDRLDKLEGVLVSMESTLSSKSSAGKGSDTAISADNSSRASDAITKEVSNPIHLIEYEDLNTQAIAVSALGSGLHQSFVGLNYLTDMRSITGSHRKPYTAWVLMIIKCPQFSQFTYCKDDRAPGVYTLLKCQTAVNMVTSL